MEALQNQAVIEDYFFVNSSEDFTVTAVTTNQIASWCIEEDTIIEVVVQVTLESKVTNAVLQLV